MSSRIIEQRRMKYAHSLKQGDRQLTLTPDTWLLIDRTGRLATWSPQQEQAARDWAMHHKPHPGYPDFGHP